MKSLKDEINDGVNNFKNPVAQMGRNIRDSVVDGIGDAVADRQEKGGKYATPRKKGCLWPIIKWILIISVVSTVLSECSGGDSATAGNSTQSSVQATEKIHIAETNSVDASSESIDSIYELIITSTKHNIETILVAEQPDTDKLQSEYEFLLSFKINEYMYKAMAYGYFTDDYESNRFADILAEFDAILQEMKMYFPEEEVDDYFNGYTIMAYQLYDEEYINYDACLIGSKNNPDVDTMWLNYVEALAVNAGWDIRNDINNHEMDMYSMLIPTESVATEPPETVVTEPTEPSTESNRAPWTETDEFWDFWGKYTVCYDPMAGQYIGPVVDGRTLNFSITALEDADGNRVFLLSYPLGGTIIESDGEYFEVADFVEFPTENHSFTNRSAMAVFTIDEYYPEYSGDFVVNLQYTPTGIEYSIYANIPGVLDTKGEMWIVDNVSDPEYE